MDEIDIYNGAKVSCSLNEAIDCICKGITKAFSPDYTPIRILKSRRATIVFWRDGTKTVVKRREDEPDSDYNAFLAALGIKYFGSNSALKRIVARTETQKQKGPLDAGFRYEK